MKFYGKAEETTNKVIDAFKNPGQLPAALAPIFLQHGNADVPCRKWSFANQFLVALAGTTDARGFQQWKQVGRSVKKGAKAFHILVPCMRTIREEDPETGKIEDRPLLYGFSTAAVFRKEDTDGAELPADTTTSALYANLPFVEVARAWGLKLETYSANPGGALVPMS